MLLRKSNIIEILPIFLLNLPEDILPQLVVLGLPSLLNHQSPHLIAHLLDGIITDQDPSLLLQGSSLRDFVFFEGEGFAGG